MVDLSVFRDKQGLIDMNRQDFWANIGYSLVLEAANFKGISVPEMCWDIDEGVVDPSNLESLLEYAFPEVKGKVQEAEVTSFTEPESKRESLLNRIVGKVLGKK